jgi:hypothetical protein
MKFGLLKSTTYTQIQLHTSLPQNGYRDVKLPQIYSASAEIALIAVYTASVTAHGLIPVSLA